MDTKNQFTYFLLSALVGLIGGLLYEIFAFFRRLFGCDRGKRKAIGVGLDMLFAFALAIFYVFACYLLHFPDFRGYMGVGFAIGLILSIKILRRILAFFKKVCYNSIARMVKRQKSRKKTLLQGDLDI